MTSIWENEEPKERDKKVRKDLYLSKEELEKFKQSVKSRTKQVEPLNEDEVIKDFIMSECLEEELGLPLEEAVKKILGKKTIPKQFGRIIKREENIFHEPISVDEKKLQQAIEQLVKFAEKRKSSQGTFLPENDIISLAFTLATVPLESKQILVSLLKPLIEPNSVDICIFVRDENVQSFKKKIQDQPFAKNTKIFKISKLKKEYQPYVQRIRLVHSYDIFMCESEIQEKLNLGKHFYKHNKTPIPVNLETLNEQINEAINSTRMFLKRGNDYFTIRVARPEWSLEEILKNVLSVLSSIGKFIPHGGASNVFRVFINTTSSPSLPIFENKSLFSILYPICKTFKKEIEWKKSNKRKRNDDKQTETTNTPDTKKIKK